MIEDVEYVLQYYRMEYCKYLEAVDGLVLADGDFFSNTVIMYTDFCIRPSLLDSLTAPICHTFSNYLYQHPYWVKHIYE